MNILELAGVLIVGVAAIDERKGGAFLELLVFKHTATRQDGKLFLGIH
jgi:hypothetical protein